MSDNWNYRIATADSLTLLLHNQHALGAAIEEIWRRKCRWSCYVGHGSVGCKCPSHHIFHFEDSTIVDVAPLLAPIASLPTRLIDKEVDPHTE